MPLSCLPCSGAVVLYSCSISREKWLYHTKRWQESSRKQQRNASNYKLRGISKWKQHHRAGKKQTQIKIWSCVKGECLGMKLRQRRGKKGKVWLQLWKSTPHCRGSVCLFVLTGMFERRSWRSKHTQPTESTLILLSPHYSLYFDLTFKGQGFAPSKGMQRKTTTTTTTAAVYVRKATSWNKI